MDDCLDVFVLLEDGEGVIEIAQVDLIIFNFLAGDLFHAFEYIGTRDTFGESGKPVDLLKKYGLDIPDIVAAAEKVMSRKTN